MVAPDQKYPWTLNLPRDSQKCGRWPRPRIEIHGRRKIGCEVFGRYRPIFLDQRPIHLINSIKEAITLRVAQQRFDQTA